MGLFGLGRSKGGKGAKPAQAKTSAATLPPDYWKKRLEQYKLEEKYRPDYKSYPQVDEELKDDGIFELAKTPEEIEANRKEIEKFRNNPLVKFLIKSEELAEQELAEERLRYDTPTRKDDAKMWRSLPHVPGPYGGPALPRMTQNRMEDVQKRFWDFFKQFQFGLWGYRQRPYPPEKPIDVQQVLGFNWLDKRYFDFTMRSGGWYYKDRLGRTRGPMELVNLKTAWAAGIVDKHTFIWGDDMDEWAPIGMVYGLQTAIETPDIKLATAGTAIVHNIARGLPILKPKKGHEKKSYKQLQQEAIELRDRENSVLRLAGGVWPGERAPSHTHFLWAGGVELTQILEGTRKHMPDRFIPYDVRKRLAQEIPGLRPWEVNDVEQVMDLMTFNKEWFREDLGEFTTRADYEQDWFETFQEKWAEISEDIEAVFGTGDEPAAQSK